MKKALLIYNVRLVDSKLDSLGAVLVFDGTIKSVFLGNYAEESRAVAVAKSVISNENDAGEIETFNGDAMTLMPSFIDMHAHFRYPGQEQKEDLVSGMNAAAAGGYTNLVLMPNTKPVISSLDMAETNNKIVDATKRGKVFQAVSITKNFDGKTISHLDNLNSRAVPVITEDGNDVENCAVMFDAMRKAGEKGIVVSCHCEDMPLREKAKIHRAKALELMKQYEIPAWGAEGKSIVPAEINFQIDENLSRANEYLALAEDIATSRNIETARLAGCHVHIAHCSTKKSMDFVRNAKLSIASASPARGIPTLDISKHKEFNVTVEVTPHHLGLVGSEAPLLRALVNPPLRSTEDRKALWKALADGTADVISTDHAPHTMNDKTAGSPGFSGLETSFSLCYTTLVKNAVITKNRLSQLMSENPAKILGLNSGIIEVGKEANFALVDEKEEWIVDATKFQSKGKATPINGYRLSARVKATFFKGNLTFKN